MWLGLDLGTSSLKAIVVDDDERVVAEAAAPLTVQRPRDGWSEQDAGDWVVAAEDVLERLGDLSGVRGIGLSGHMHGATLLDAAHRPLRPCILWNDTRSHAEAARLDADPRFRERTGNIVFPGFTAPKLAWVAAHEPEIFARTALVLLPKDALRLWLTGEAVAEMSDAAGTSWLHTGRRDWDDDLLASTGLTRAQMPRLVEGSEVSARLRDAIADRFGLPRGTPVAGGGGDNAASAVGVGVTRPGEAFVSLGTSGVLFAATPSYAPDAASAVHTFCHALPGTWHQMGVILSATDSLNWLARLTGRDPGSLAGEVRGLAAPGHPLFLPYLGGERTPHNDAAVRGAFLHLDHATDAAAAARAVMEGVTFALKDCADALAATGTRIDRLVAVGGGSRSEAWLGMIATALGLPVDVPDSGEVGAALGAARLGRMAVTGDLSAPPPAIARTALPDPALADAFAAGHARYRAAYPATRTL